MTGHTGGLLQILSAHAESDDRIVANSKWVIDN